MGLRAHEFVVMQDDDTEQEKTRKGSLILSEVCKIVSSFWYSTTRTYFSIIHWIVLIQCIAVNPWDGEHNPRCVCDAGQGGADVLGGPVVAQSAQAFVTGFLNQCMETTMGKAIISSKRK